ncbi:hypothetical protein NWP13_21640 [Rhodococcus pyridinivorans]|nr:hypothetical protein [Rhodococcus pyridinivorans]
MEGKSRRTVVIGLRCQAYDPTVHVEVYGLDIAVEPTGTGPAVVLAHGFVGDAHSTWGRQIEVLSDEYTVIAWDAPGAGHVSTVEAPNDVTRELRRFLRSVESPLA